MMRGQLQLRYAVPYDDVGIFLHNWLTGI